MTTMRPFYCIAASVLLVSAVAAQEPEPMPTVEVTGEAEVLVAPDRVVVQAAVWTRATGLTDATKENDLKISQVMQFLQQSGVDDKSIRTTAIVIEPIFGNERSTKAAYAQQQADDAFADDNKKGLQDLRPTGYSVYKGLELTISDLSRFETVYRGLVERGINDISDVQFQTSELQKYRSEARLAAVRAAREKAKAMAEELGATLAAVQSIRERNYDTGTPLQSSLDDPFGNSTADAADGAIPAGQIRIQASVNITFRLGDVELTD